MRITRRTGGGRGDYEISERAGQLSPRDLVDHRIRLGLGQGIVIDTGAALRYRNGKFRLRAEGSPLHIPRQIAAALLMPHPVRANAALRPGSPIMRTNAYAIQHLNLSQNITLQNGVADAMVESVVIRNADGDQQIDVGDRMSNLISVWNSRSEFPDAIGDLLAQHEGIVRSGGPLPKLAEQTVKNIEEALSAVAPDFELQYSSGSDVLWALVESQKDIDSVPPTPVGDIDPEDTELKTRNVKEWKRWASSRGIRSARFRQRVRAAYQSRCIVCGSSFPVTSGNRTPGVDAAHILPWAQYDLDHVQNGLCLCKIHHWTFDEGLIRIEYSEGSYFIVVPDEIRQTIAAEAPGFDLGALTQYAGPVPLEHLPSNPSERPRPRFLERRWAAS